MTATRLLHFLALSSLAVLLCSLSLAPVNALSVDSSHLARRAPHAHDVIAKKKRATSSTKRCKPRPSAAASSLALAAAKSTPVTSTQAPAPTTAKAKPKETPASTPAPAPSPKPSPTPAPAPPSGGKRGLGWDSSSSSTLADWHHGEVSW